ncbi:MAG TPA: Maf family protein [Beijerinckiaceae bacterium]|nr:Maf family protein [Beijerinckiaceae bacterium]
MSDGASIWRGSVPLLLASTSETRRRLLASAGLSVDMQAPHVDERAVAETPADSGETACRLAEEKALAVSRLRPGRLVLGADQTLACDGQAFHKPADRAAARQQLIALSGRTHVLHSAFALAEAGSLIYTGVEEARMTVRVLDGEAIDSYLRHAGDAAWASVGAYQAEGLGIHLFERVAGDHSTVLGLPLIPLLAVLRTRGLLAF